MRSEKLSSGFLQNQPTIPLDEFVMLDPTDMGKRETVGSRLYKRRMELGLSLAQLREKILSDWRFEIGDTTIRVYEMDKVPNPGIKTLEFLALGLGLDPVELVTLALDDPPETETGYKESQFAQLWHNYKRLGRDQKAFVDQSVNMLTMQIQRWKED